METQTIINEIKEILNKNLPSDTYIQVSETRSYFDKQPEIKIVFAVSDYEINQVKGQFVQDVSLLLELSDMDLHPQIFGGNGGQCIYRKPNMDDPKEKYLAMKSVKIPFRKPKPELKFVYGAIERFAKNFVKAIQENKDVLMYQDLVDYDKYLNS
jgi:hypothetical protein